MTGPSDPSRQTSKRSYRAPIDDGGTFIDPPFASLAEVIESNQQQAGNDEFLIAGEPVGELRSSLRNFVLRASRAEPNENAIWIVSGHQPQLFHPGVWYKNFLLDRIRKQHSAIGLNVIIDCDLCRANSIRVPTGSIDNPVLDNVPFDDSGDWVPYEERTIQNMCLFESFAQRVSDTVSSFVPAPILRDHWRRAILAVNTNPNVGFAFSQLRHGIETEWGSQTIELPLSRLCQRREFRLFVLHVIRHRSTFVEVYNRSLKEYRSTNRIRSRSHPVPPLNITNEWCELPFWVWQTSRPRRQALQVRVSQNYVELTDSNSVWRVQNESKTELFLEQLAELEERGVKIRPRALTTTMFLRILLSDLFLHGIGGAKYDELTDVICLRMGLVPPQYVCATATMCLPINLPATSKNRLGELRHLAREYRFHPERFISETESSENQVSRWILQKKIWIEHHDLAVQRQARHLKITEANRKMQPLLQEKTIALEQELQKVRTLLRAHERLGSREFSFVLFPESQLRSTMGSEFPRG